MLTLRRQNGSSVRDIGVWILGAVCVFIVLTATVGATTLEQLNLDTMIGQASAIVRAKVEDSSSVLRGQNVYTVYKLSVLENLTGNITARRATPLAAVTELAVPGGVIKKDANTNQPGMRQMVDGAPQLRAGREYVLFLWRGRSGLTQLMGLSQGLFISPAANSGAWVQTAATERMVDGRGHLVAPEAISFNLAELKARVARVALKKNEEKSPEKAQDRAAQK